MRHKRTLITTLALFIASFFLLTMDIQVQAATTEDGWEYEELEDGTIKILKYIGSDASVVIPAQIDGKNVTIIGYHTFYQNSTMVSLVIPYGITSTEYGAIDACTNLQKVAIPSSVVDVGGSLWRDCANVKFLYVEAGSYVEGCAVSSPDCHRIYQGDINCAHTFGSKITKVANCITTGEKTFTCGKCGGYYTERYWDDAHTVVTDPAVAATCTDCGKTEGSHCSVCGLVLLQQEITSELGHSYKTTIKKATPKKNGSVTTKCSQCGNIDTTQSDTIPKIKKILLHNNKVIYTGKAQKMFYAVEDRKGNYIEAKNYTVTYKNNKKVGKATVTVKLKGKYYSGKLTKTFTINPKATFISKVKAKRNDFSVKWEKQTKQITGYQIQYATKKNFKNAKSVWVKNYKTEEKTISNLQEQTKYYVRVRTYKEVKINGKKKKFYSTWSPKQEVTTRIKKSNIVYQPSDIHIVYKSGWSWVDKTVSSYDEACAVAKALGYEVWKIHYDENGKPWYYALFCNGAGNRGIFEEDFYEAYQVLEDYRKAHGIQSANYHIGYLNTKDGDIYIPSSDGFSWELTTLGVQ